MLQNGVIPKSEPLIRVGIILPEDKQNSLNLEITHPQHTELTLGSGSQLSLESISLDVEIKDNRLCVKTNGNSISSNSLKIKQTKCDSSVTIHSVIAGRGFHWAKHIPVKLPHTVEFSVVDGHLLLINELPLETYLACVATSEMGAACPSAFLEAQTIVARSWMLANIEQKHIFLGFDVCNDDCCQRYQGKNNFTEQSFTASFASSGQVLIYDEKICDARYSKSCGGVMETFENLWENTPLPYMKNITDTPQAVPKDLSDENTAKEWILSSPISYCSSEYIPEKDLKKYLGDVDESGEYYRWTVEISQEELCKHLQNIMDPELATVLDLLPLKRAGSARLLELEIQYLNKSGTKKTKIVYKDYEVRRLLHPMFLYSSAIVIDKKEADPSKTPEKFIYHGAGWGHGAGLCQIGGLGMGLNGKSAEEIVLHYYPGSKLEKIY